MTSSAQLAQPGTTAAQADNRCRFDHALARQMLGERLPRRALAGESRDIGGARRGLLGGDLVLGRRGLEFREFEFRLVDQPYGSISLGYLRVASRDKQASKNGQLVYVKRSSAYEETVIAQQTNVCTNIYIECEKGLSMGQF